MAEMVSQRADAWVATLRGDSLYFTSVAIPRICFYVQSAITGFKIFHRLMKYPMHPRHFGWPRIFAGYPRDFDDMAISRQELASRRSIDPSTQGTRLEEQVSNCLNGNRSGTGWGACQAITSRQGEISRNCVASKRWEILCTATASVSNLQLDFSDLLTNI